ncbi:MAG: hypothetical protein H0U23_14870 [Blastocatellia bacterium]|nr:hypothetical protein [Blastocatellia bacterium]
MATEADKFASVKNPLLPILLTFLAPLFSVQLAKAQIAPAAVVFADGAPGEHYVFRSEGIFPLSSAFAYLNYNTGEIDSIITTVQPGGTFSGSSSVTGLTVSGSITATTVTFVYKGITRTVPIASSYGSASAYAGVWTGPVVDPSLGVGVGTTVITAQGQMFVVASQGFSINEGFGTINSAGQFSVPLLDGRTVSGTFPSPSYGRVIGSFSVSDGTTETASLIRAVPSRLLNISTRGFVGTGEQVLIGGFIIGHGGKTVLMDAKGPSLSAQGVASPVQATQISLYFGSQLIASNNGWRNSANSGEIAASGLAPTDDRESALQVALEPGAYTVIVSSADGSTGIGLVEVFGVGDTEGP